MKVSFRKLLLPAAVLAALAGAPEARSDEVLHLTPGRAVNVKVPGTDNYLGLVGDPETADVFFGPKNNFIFVGKKDGVTNIVVIDKDNGAEMYKATLEVGSGTKVSVRVYSGQPNSDNFLCGKSSCAPSDITTVTTEIQQQQSQTPAAPQLTGPTK